MYVRNVGGVIYVYRDLDLMLDSITKYQHMVTRGMYTADFAISINPDAPDTGRVVKDRSGIFGTNSVSAKKFLEIVNFLMEKENFN
jgi:hypothetical protein